MLLIYCQTVVADPQISAMYQPGASVALLTFDHVRSAVAEAYVFLSILYERVCDCTAINERHVIALVAAA